MKQGFQSWFIIYKQTNLLFQRWLKSPSLQTKAWSPEVKEVNAQETGGQENVFFPFWREYSKDTKETMLHHFPSSSHTASCRTVRNASTSYLIHLLMRRPLGLSAERGEKWLEIHNRNHRGKDFTTLYIDRIRQICWGWSKSFAWISGHSCKEKVFLGTLTDLWSCIHCYRDYTTSKTTPPYLLSPFRWNPDVSVPYPAWKGLSSSPVSSQISTPCRGLSQSPPCCSLHRNL